MKSNVGILRKKSKSVSEIIAVILMLFLLLALTGTAYFFISGIFTSKTSSLFIPSEVFGNTIQMSNIGTNSLNNMQASVNNVPAQFYIECPSKIVFSDNFDNGTASAWNAVSGNWYVMSQTYRGDSITSGTAESYANLNYTSSTIQVQFKIGEQKAVDVMLIFDRSGSMAGQKIADSKTAAKTFVGNFDPSRDQSGLVSYNETARLDQNLTSNQTLVQTKIDSLVAAGYTNIGAAIYNATGELRAHGRADSTWIEVLLSDGIPNRPNNENYGQQYALNASKNASSYGVIIYTIGLGSDVNATLLQEIANNANGKYYFAPDTSTLGQIYQQIAGEIASGTAGVIIKRGAATVATVSVIETGNRVNITNAAGTVVGTGNYTVVNNTFYNMKVTTYGSQVFVNINGTDVVSGDIGDSGLKNRFSLFSSQSLVLFDNIAVSDNSFDPGKFCDAYLFNFTKVPGTYTVTLRTPDAVRRVALTIPP